MITVCKQGIDANRAVEVSSCAADISQIVFSDTPVEESPVGICVKMGKDVELLDSLSVLSVLKGYTAPELENFCVPLGAGRQT